jgi:large subunit ribosomal protein L29
MKAADLREKSVEDLVELQKSLTGDVFQNRLKNFTNRLDDTSAIRKGRRDLARVLTLLRERAPQGAGAAAAPAAKKPAAPKAKAKTAAPAAGAEAKPKKTAAAKKSTGKKTEKSEAK